MILNRYLTTNLFLIIIIYLFGINVSGQNQTVLVFDPLQVSTNYQNSFHQLSSDSLYIVDTLDENINSFDALFLFIGYPYVLSEDEGNRLIEYLNLNKPIYLYTNLLWQDIEYVAFWNHLSVNLYFELLAEVHVNHVVGVDTAFTKDVFIDTSFISAHIPYIDGEVAPILDGIPVDTLSLGLSTTFIPKDESLNVIIDLYNLIHHTEFLERVLPHFGLDNPNSTLDSTANQPNVFYLQQNYPNPFNPSTKITYRIPKLSFVTLKIFDVLGSEIATLINEEKPAGSYEVEFSATSLASGIYLYQLQAGNFIETRKMVLLK